MPDAHFIATLFASAGKARGAVALSQAYVHYSFYNADHCHRLMEVIEHGLQKYDYDKIKPFLILFQHLLEQAHASPVINQMAEQWIKDFFETMLLQQVVCYQLVEVVTDWVIKVAFRLPLMRDWMRANPKSWSYLIDFFKLNPEPPMLNNYDRTSNIRLTKSINAKISPYRYTDPIRNRAHNFYRRNCLIQIKSGQGIPDVSGEVDIDYYHLDDFKLQKDQKVYLCLDKHLQLFAGTIVCTEMDELCYVRTTDTEQLSCWEATDKGRPFLSGIWENSYKVC